MLALTQAETVGTWIGLLSAVVSVVLSIVAIVFARDVDRRSLEVSNQTIRSLQSIEATVQRLSDDTVGLIKMAWERMLGSMASAAPGDHDLQAQLAGLFSEFRQDAHDLAPGPGIDQLVRSMSERVSRAASRSTDGDHGLAPAGWAFNFAIAAIDSLSPLAIELLRALDEGPHLTRVQYNRLRQDQEIALAIDELRDDDILLPLQRRSDRDETVYGLAPWFKRVIGPALVFTGHEIPDRLAAERVLSALRDVGFPVDAAVGLASTTGAT